ETELAATKQEMVKAGESVRDHEALVQALEDRIAKLTAESAEIEAGLAKNYGAISDLVLTLARMRRVPPETLIVRPGAPLATAQSAMLLQGMLQTVHTQAVALSENLRKLHEARQQLEADRAQAQQAQAALDAKYAEITALAQKRSRLYKDIDKNYRSSSAAVDRLAAQAQNLQDLMKRLEAEKEDVERPAPAKPSSLFSRKSSAKKAPSVLPVYGKILASFGDKDDIGATSQGVTIETQPMALVVAPFSGTVKFSGNFKDYGPVIIIQHEKKYHSLLIGMDRITATTGQDVDAGEPVGRLPSASSRGGPPTLYYELRLKGRPIDPSAKSIDIRS
ncbi:MAG TPA: peptidoglycan DD-metalloendopeptidase family protein, partial [Alphaproteobacteria bacterium]